jgi:hypothetical protein
MMVYLHVKGQPSRTYTSIADFLMRGPDLEAMDIVWVLVEDDTINNCSQELSLWDVNWLKSLPSFKDPLYLMHKAMRQH